eukprot:CAMPEP_0170534032 /NCGR_PEP_ID=MMETSP0209-20121228/87651_1 /TAXON_ID=665100 ORGANISM="Litonotus pictus, Strain P1" /NCGR_SAMPLE_ID=MMETSP0209 /ASSEMBLY_ACC=CAM_ASM_000301 /LENGTH=73 /DNA_ID=CAMNT_0010832741 /DNA_START=285 /DNA_END=502 /DNA_ORIENTATION=-
MSLQKEVQLTEYEMKAYDLVSRLASKEENKIISAKYIDYGMKYITAKNKYMKHSKKAKRIGESLSKEENTLKS